MIERLVGIAFGTLICAVASAQSLEDRVRELERRVEQLERLGAQASAPANAPKPASSQPDAYAQTILDGTWRGTIVTPVGTTMNVELRLSDRHGTWRFFAQGPQVKDNPCLGQAYDAAISDAPDGQLQLTASSALQGCQSIRATFHLTASNSLRGKFPNGRDISLDRK